MTTPIEKDLGSPSPPQHVAVPMANAVPMSLRETDRATLRPMVAQLESDLASLQVQSDADGYAAVAARLAAPWRSLVDVMALGTAPELRACPYCGYGINATATRCIQCWKQSEAKGRFKP